MCMRVQYIIEKDIIFEVRLPIMQTVKAPCHEKLRAKLDKTGQTEALSRQGEIEIF